MEIIKTTIHAYEWSQQVSWPEIHEYTTVDPISKPSDGGVGICDGQDFLDFLVVLQFAKTSCRQHTSDPNALLSYNFSFIYSLSSIFMSFYDFKKLRIKGI